MDPSPAVAIPIPYRSRRGWLIAFGVIEILMGCGFLLMILFFAIAFFGPLCATMPPSMIPPGAFMVMVGFQYGLLAAVFFTGGIGSIRCKNWARILMLVVSGLWLVIGIIAALMMALLFPTIMHQQPGNIPPGIKHGIMVGMVGFMIVVMVLLPAIFLFFYSRKSVRATCLTQKGAQLAAPAAGETAMPGLPIPLVILAVWESFSALSVFACLFMQVTIMFGVVLHGAAAILVLLTYSLLSGYTAWMIFRQKLIGWQIAILKTGFWTISMLVTYIRRPDMLQVFREMGYNSQTLRIYEQSPQLMPSIWLGTTVMMVLLIVFILYTRRFFPRDTNIR